MVVERPYCKLKVVGFPRRMLIFFLNKGFG